MAQGAGDSPAVSAPSSVETAGGSDGSGGVVPAPQTTSSSSSSVPQGRNRREVMDMLSRGAISPAEAEAQLADLESSAEKRGLGDRVSAAHNAGATVRQHLPEDSASVSAPTLNIHHGE